MLGFIKYSELFLDLSIPSYLQVPPTAHECNSSGFINYLSIISSKIREVTGQFPSEHTKPTISVYPEWKCRKFHQNLNKIFFFLVKQGALRGCGVTKFPTFDMKISNPTLNICSDNHTHTPKIKNISNNESKGILPTAKRKAPASKLHMHKA